ncbi:MAG: hypothetical protein M1820_002169 [Bogoriella megaspora]|nr:MAG: hypothetical protein M1820_002169 [Bogoriella megaspora]
MRSPYICPNCRQWLLRRAQKFPRTQRRFKTDHSPLASLLSPLDGPLPNARTLLPTRENAAKGGNRSAPASAKSRGSEFSWNLEEIFTGKLGPGRYSAAFLPQASEAPPKPPEPAERPTASWQQSPQINDRLSAQAYSNAVKSETSTNTLCNPIAEAVTERLDSQPIHDRDEIPRTIKQPPSVATQLLRMMDKETPSNSVWQFIVENRMDPGMRRKLGDLSHRGMFVSEFAKNMFNLSLSWCNSRHDKTLPTPSESCNMLRDSGLMCYEAYAAALTRLTFFLAARIEPHVDRDNLRRSRDVLEEVLSVWELLFRDYGSWARFNESGQGLSLFDWSLLPEPEKASKTGFQEKYFYKSFHQVLLPNAPENMACPKEAIPAAALALSGLFRAGDLSTHLTPGMEQGLLSFTNNVRKMAEGRNIRKVIRFCKTKIVWKRRLEAVFEKEGLLDVAMEPTTHELRQKLNEEVATAGELAPEATSLMQLTDMASEENALHDEHHIDADALEVQDPSQFEAWGRRTEENPPISAEEPSIHHSSTRRGDTPAHPIQPQSQNQAQFSNEIHAVTNSVPLQSTSSISAPDFGRQLNTKLKTEDSSMRSSRHGPGSETRLNFTDPGRKSSVTATHIRFGANQEQLLQKQLSRALEKRNSKFLETLWGRALEYHDLSQKSYESFIYTFMNMGLPESAINAWNSMIASGHTPTVVTWTSMLQGCRHERDVEALKSIWQKMRNAGVQPDTHAWNVRIYGLIRGGKVREGLIGLQEMTAEWQAAAKRIVADPKNATEEDKAVPKPDVHILNSVISTLSRGSQDDHINKVFQWAKAIGIKPDIVTYNAQIAQVIRRGDTQKAYALLNSMSKEDIAPNIVTLTILLDALFQDPALTSCTPSEQRDIVLNFLSSIEQHGLEASAYSYSKIVDRLLKHHNNTIAARAVLAHMSQRKMPPSPALYTILLTHYLSRSPPDIAAVDALMYEIEVTPNAVTDRVFYDRMVEGYADAGEVGRMMTTLGKMSREGKSPGWLALEKVVRLLADVGDLARAREVVVEARKGPLKRGAPWETGLQQGAKREFDRLVVGLGLDVNWGMMNDGMAMKQWEKEAGDDIERGVAVGEGEGQEVEDDVLLTPLEKSDPLGRRW